MKAGKVYIKCEKKLLALTKGSKNAKVHGIRIQAIEEKEMETRESFCEGRYVKNYHLAFN